MALDHKRLRRDAKRLQDKRSKSRSGRRTTGATEAVRTALPEIYKLRDQGVLWSDIAKALGEQGVIEGKKRVPLTTNGLTARVSQIEQQIENAAAKKPKKLPPVSPSETNALQSKRNALQKHHLALSDELAADTHTTDGRSSQSEDDLRRVAFEKVQRMTKKD
jgi:hypothetical protein